MRTRGIAAGDIAFLLRQHRDRGIIAAARFVDGLVYQDEHWLDPSSDANYADIEWLRVLPLNDRLPIDILKNRVPGVTWDRLQGSGVQLRSKDGQRLQRLWDQHVTQFPSPVLLPDEAGDDYEEGGLLRVQVNRYERDPRARQPCLDHYGTSCSVCNIDLGDTYGTIGEGFIHVHHLDPIAGRRRQHVHPIKDLRPLCPNCHAMAHQENPPLGTS